MNSLHQESAHPSCSITRGCIVRESLALFDELPTALYKQTQKPTEIRLYGLDTSGEKIIYGIEIDYTVSQYGISRTPSSAIPNVAERLVKRNNKG